MIDARICDLKGFFDVVNGCGAQVAVVAPGTLAPQELRNNEFLQAVLLRNHTDVTFLSVQPHSSADALRIMRFMIGDRRLTSSCRA